MSYGAYTILSYAGLLSVLVTAFLAFRKKIGFIQGMLFSAAGLVISFIAAVMALNVSSGQNFIDILINEQFKSIKDTITAMGDDVIERVYGVSIAQLNAAVETVKTAYAAAFPSMIVISSIIMAFCLFMLIKTVLRIFRRDVSAFTDFVMLKMPKSAMNVLLISVIGSFILEGTVKNAFFNVTTVIMFLNIVCGFSLVLFIIKNRTENIAMRILLYVGAVLALLILANFASYVLGMLAIADAFLDIRNRRSKGGYDEQERE